MRNISSALTKKNKHLPLDLFWTLRRYWLQLLLIFHFSFFIFQCGFDVEDPTPPSTPVWVQKSLPGEWPERGIDAHESGGICLEWEPNTKEDIFAYNIYGAIWYNVNDSLGEYELLARQETESTLQLKYIFESANIYTTYYFIIQAEDASGNESEHSESQHYSLLPKQNVITMIPNSQSSNLPPSRRLTWRYPYTIEMEDYCITILTEADEFIHRVVISPRDYVDGGESWRIPNNVVLDSGKAYKWRLDTGANYIDELETTGSESFWAPFMFIDD
jgi:hypothetical protein